MRLPLARSEGFHENSFGIAPGQQGQSGRTAASNPGATRVGLEIAGRAHREKFTPKLGISLQRINVKKNQPLREKSSNFFIKNVVRAT
jgi:hypothetical protein